MWWLKVFKKDIDSSLLVYFLLFSNYIDKRQGRRTVWKSGGASIIKLGLHLCHRFCPNPYTIMAIIVWLVIIH